MRRSAAHTLTRASSPRTTRPPGARTCHLADRYLRLGDEAQDGHGRDRLERAVLERQLLGTSEMEGDVDATLRRPRASRVEHRRIGVERRDGGAASGGLDRVRAITGSYVEQALVLKITEKVENDLRLFSGMTHTRL